jgi:hypothetical protein
MKDLAEVVSEANTLYHGKQQNRIGKAKASFANLCEIANDYKQVTAMIPSQDKYFSLLTGSFSLIVMVCSASDCGT